MCGKEAAGEGVFRLEVIMEGRVPDRLRVAPLWQRADGIVTVMAQSRKTAENNLKTAKS